MDKIHSRGWPKGSRSALRKWACESFLAKGQPQFITTPAIKHTTTWHGWIIDVEEACYQTIRQRPVWETLTDFGIRDIDADASNQCRIATSGQRRAIFEGVWQFVKLFPDIRNLGDRQGSLNTWMYASELTSCKIVSQLLGPT